MDERNLVVPGEKIVDGMDYLPGDGTHRAGSEIRADVLGLADVRDRLVKVIPLSGRYMPKREDPVIGVIKEVRYNNWDVDINSPYDATMMLADASERFLDPKKDLLSKVFGLGDVVICKIKNIEENMGVLLTARGPGLRKLTGGRILKVKPSKIPRIIGKSASMIKMIKERTGTHLFVGQNGLIWLEGGNEELAIKVIRKIEKEAHVSGLTDEITKILEVEGSGIQTELPDQGE
jgi:exosome complex component RRP4